MTQKLKIVFCIKKMKKNKHSIVKNVSYFETKAKNLYFVSRK